MSCGAKSVWSTAYAAGIGTLLFYVFFISSFRLTPLLIRAILDIFHPFEYIWCFIFHGFSIQKILGLDKFVNMCYTICTIIPMAETDHTNNPGSSNILDT